MGLAPAKRKASGKGGGGGGGGGLQWKTETTKWDVKDTVIPPIFRMGKRGFPAAYQLSPRYYMQAYGMSEEMANRAIAARLQALYSQRRDKGWSRTKRQYM